MSIIKREHITTEIKAENTILFHRSQAISCIIMKRSQWEQDMLSAEASSSCPAEATGDVQSILELVASSMTSTPGICEIASIASPISQTKLINRRASSSKEA